MPKHRQKRVIAMDNMDLIESFKRSQIALERLSWETIKAVRNANQRLYPIYWGKVVDNWKGKPLKIKSKEEFEEKLKEVCDSLYGWGLYEPCPKCNKGIKIPVWNFTQWTAFCGCSCYPQCDYSMDRGGEPIL
ncbi:hypothetical protein OBV_p-00430 (plasmid) [Oscillibacter valericigenes Sjm18-20]|nr:hypothetical protein OBV_p-00430 [Oscillibacter valericigenes Sjm18-20]